VLRWNSFQRGYISVRIFACIEVKICTRGFIRGSYSNYQKRLSDRVLKLRREGLTFKAIANELNAQGWRSTRGKMILPKHAFAIWKKRLIRDHRLNSPANVTLENVSVHYVVV